MEHNEIKTKTFLNVSCCNWYLQKASGSGFCHYIGLNYQRLRVKLAAKFTAFVNENELLLNLLCLKTLICFRENLGLVLFTSADLVSTPYWATPVFVNKWVCFINVIILLLQIDYNCITRYYKKSLTSFDCRSHSVSIIILTHQYILYIWALYGRSELYVICK